jgi:hypothetical protein
LTEKTPVRRTLWLLALCATVMLYAFPYFPKLGNPNEKLRLYATAAIVEEGTFAVNTLRQRWGWVNDAAEREGKFYSVKGPATSYLGVPAYWAYSKVQAARGEKVRLIVATWLLRVTASVLPALLFFFALHRWLLRRVRRPWVADVVAVGVALGSPLFAYAVLFVSHTLVAALLFGAFALLLRAQRQGYLSRGHAFVAGLCTAGVTFCEYPGFIASLLLSVGALVVVRPIWRLLPFAAGGLVPTLAMMHYQWRAFGSPLTPGHLMLENRALRSGHESGFFGADGIRLESLLGLTVNPQQGLFPLVPLLLFGFVGFVLLWRRRERFGVGLAVAICLGMYVVISAMNNWRGGWSIGPRYLTMLIPLFAWASAVAIDQLSERWPRAVPAVAVGAATVGLLVTGTASAIYPHMPEGIQRMWPDLFWLCFLHGFAPYNALNLLGVWGSLSLLPLALLGVGVVVVLVRAVPELRGGRALAGAAAAFILLSLPTLVPLPGDKGKKAVAHVLREWTPQGHDDPALWEAALAEEADRKGLETLKRLYEREHRAKEVKRTEKRLRALGDPSEEAKP